MTQYVPRFALAFILVLVTVALATAQGRLTPVMRIGDWVEIGGETPVAFAYQAEQRLKAAGFDPGPIDGILDAKTTTALRQYQMSQDLPVTGRLDEATRKALGIK